MLESGLVDEARSQPPGAHSMPGLVAVGNEDDDEGDPPGVSVPVSVKLYDVWVPVGSSAT